MKRASFLETVKTVLWGMAGIIRGQTPGVARVRNVTDLTQYPKVYRMAALRGTVPYRAATQPCAKAEHRFLLKYTRTLNI